VSHYLALIKSLPFVHTARRYYRLNDLVRTLEGPAVVLIRKYCLWLADKDVQTISFRGSKSRNKVSVCEPADGSLSSPQPRLVRPLFHYISEYEECVCALHLSRKRVAVYVAYFALVPSTSTCCLHSVQARQVTSVSGRCKNTPIIPLLSPLTTACCVTAT
jgi:hypothetical protein